LLNGELKQKWLKKGRVEVKLFEHFPENAKCPVCDTNEDKECFLIPIDDTEKGNICEAAPTHADCIMENLNQFNYNKELGIIYLLIDNLEKKSENTQQICG
jgi:hypothetical protein